MNDKQRLDWLAKVPERLREVYWRLENEDEQLREAIDALAGLQRVGDPDNEEG
jgi:hypothetical protein